MIEDLQITVLVEDRARAGLQPEVGLALWIAADHDRLLLDTGAGEALFVNAEACGIDLRTVDAVVLSHGHRDHSGGLGRLLEVAPEAQVYFHPAAIEPRFSSRRGPPRPIGMGIDAISALARRQLRGSEGWHPVAPAIWCGGAIPRRPDEQSTDPHLWADPLGRRPDPLPDDQALVLQTRAGLVVCCGCCHAGLGPTLRHVQARFPDEGIAVMLGGFHLKAAAPGEILATAELLAGSDIGQIIAGHCTGGAAEDLLGSLCGSRFAKLIGGDRWRWTGGRLERE